MNRILLLAPGPLTPADDAGLHAMAALATRHLVREKFQVVAVSPTPGFPAARFADRSYAEPLDATTLSNIVAREEPNAIFATFAGCGGLDVATTIAPHVPILGLPRAAEALARLRGACKPASADRGVADSDRLVIEILRDAAGAHVVLGVLGLGDPKLSESILRSPASAPGAERSWRAAARHLLALLAEERAFGVFSAVVAITPDDAHPALLDVYVGARASTIAAARAIHFPLASVSAQLAHGVTLATLGIHHHPPLPTAVRTPTFAHSRFGVEAGRAPSAIGQSLKAEHGSREPKPLSERPRVYVFGAGPTTLDQPGASDAWAAASVLAARDCGYEVVVVDDDPGSLAGALADGWILGTAEANLARVSHGDAAFVMAAPNALALCRTLLDRGARVLDQPNAGMSPEGGALPATSVPPDARKFDVLVLGDGQAHIVVGAIEYVEPASVHVADSAAFFPPQTLAEVDVRQAEEHMRELATRSAFRGLCTGTWFVTPEGPRLGELRFGPSSSTAFAEAATGVPLAHRAAQLALAATLDSLGLCDVPTPPFVAAREVVLPRALLAVSRAALDQRKRSIGEAMGIGETLAAAYQKAIAGVGFPLTRARGRMVLLAPDAANVSDAIIGARKLHPLGFRIVATGEVIPALAAVRLPFEAVDADGALRALTNGDVALSFVTGYGAAGSGDVLALRRASLTHGIPCFTSALLFRAACGVLEENVPSRVRPLPD